MTQKKRKFWFVLMTISSSFYILWRLFFTIPVNYGIVSLIAGIALFAAELISNLEAMIHMRCISRDYDLKMPAVPKDLYPHVDVLIATHSEDASLLLKTVNGCCHMEYPDSSKVHIYLCDDANRSEIKALAEKMKVGYFGLSENQYAKAGNLNNALEKTDSPLVVTFDADMIPRREFLMKTVPYFFLPKMIEENGVWRMRTEEEIDKDFKIGFIQTPQSFYNPDLFQFNFFAETTIPNEQDYFFREVNLGRNGSNSAIYAGSNTVIAREALEAVGGIRTGTITEDFATGIDIQAKGYTTYAIDTVLASGLAPNDFADLLRQRQRWGRGCVQTVRSIKFWTNKLPLLSKLSYLGCLFYWWTFIRRFIYILAPILYVVFDVLVVRCSLIELACIWLPSYLIYNQTLKILSGKTRNQRWSNIVDTIICPYMIVPIFMETVGLSLREFAVTNKAVSKSKSVRFRYAIPHIVLLAATIPGIMICVRDMVLYQNIGSIVVLFWLVMNGYFLLMAILFMTGRVNFRSAERYYTHLPLNIFLEEHKITVETADISENGFAFFLNFPEYIPINEDTVFKLYDRGIEAEVRGTIVHVEQQGELWKYSVRLTPEENRDRLEYLQMVYDRDASLAIDIKSNAYKELSAFAHKKTASALPANRKLPRIALHQQMQTGEGRPAIVTDYNYQYVTLEGTEGKESLQLQFTQDILLQLEKSRKRDNLYQIKDWEKISKRLDLRDALFRMMIQEGEHEKQVASA